MNVEKVTSIFEGWIYDHAQYTTILETLATEIEYVFAGSSPIVFPLLGDSRAGKTALLKDIEARFGNQLSESGHKRVLRVSMPTAASNETLAKSIIKKILGDIPIKGKTFDILERAQQTMQAAGVLVLLIDETNHLIEKRSTERAQNKDNRLTADWLKELVDQSGISVVVTGLSHVSRLYADNDQLENRGLVGARIDPYAWSNQSDRQQFRDTVSAGIAHMQDHGWTVSVEMDLLTRTIYLGGGGYIGKARDLLARMETLGNKQKLLDRKLLAKAYSDKYRRDAIGDPLLLKTIDDVMLNGAHRKAMERALISGRGR